MSFNSLKQHISKNKNQYIAGAGITLSLLGAYYLWNSKKTPIPAQYWDEEYRGAAGITKSLADQLGRVLEGSVNYDLKLWIQPAQHRFKGVATINFKLKPDFKEDLYLSVGEELEIFSIKIDGHKITDALFLEMVETQKGSLYLANRHISTDSLSLTITYKGSFGQAYGLLSYEDVDSPEGDLYVFTSNNTVGTSSIFPVFESHLVRSTFRLHTIIPSDWTAISNEKEDEPTGTPQSLSDSFCKLEEDPSAEGFRTVSFRQTKAIPFNSLNVAAGNFKEFKTKSKVQARSVQVYCMRSEETKVQGISEHIGKIVKEAVSRLEKITGVKYPFPSSDILVLPDQLIFPNIFNNVPFKVCGEYPGLTSIFLKDYHTFKEEFVYELVSNVSRLWFGCVVSLASCSDLWLTEGLARYVALRIIRDEPAAFDLNTDGVEYLRGYLNSQALYSEIQNDVTRTNLPLAYPVKHSYDSGFLPLAKAEKVGLWKFEELFSTSTVADSFSKTVKEIFTNYSWSAIGVQEFKQIYSTVNKLDEKHKQRLYWCFDDQYLDEIKFSRTSETTITVQTHRRNTSDDILRSYQIQILLLKKNGEVVDKISATIGESSRIFTINPEVYTFLSILTDNSLYYEDYHKDELSRIFSTNLSTAELRFKAARVLFTNTLKSKNISLTEGFAHLKSLLGVCSQKEQVWALRSFCVIAKHIEKSEKTLEILKEFLEFLIDLAVKNRSLIPYLCYYSAGFPETREIVTEFVKVVNESLVFDPKSSLLNYDLLKSSMLMITCLRLDLEKAHCFSTLVSRYDPAVGNIIKTLLDRHAEDLVSEKLKIVNQLKDIFTQKPQFSNSLDYYFKTLQIRTDKTEEMFVVREYLRKIAEQPEETMFGKKNLIYYNVMKFLSNASKDDLEEEARQKSMDPQSMTGKDIDSMVARRFTHHFRLS